MDYSVRSTPYKGAYEFKPYLVELRPTPRPSDEGRFYLRAGAGYGLHPEFTLVWMPVRTDRFRLHLFADQQGYFGQYKGVALQDGWFGPDGSRYNGFAARTLAGVAGQFGWNGGALEARLNYRNVMGSDTRIQQAMYHALDFHAHLKSHPDAALLYELETADTGFWSPFVNEFHSLTRGAIGTHFGMHYLTLGASVELISQQDGFVGNLAFSPRYLLTPGDFRLDLGAKVSFLFRSDEAFYPYKFVFPLFPDVRVTYYLLPDVVALQASASGGHIMNVYSSLVDENAFLGGWTGITDGTAFGLQPTVERWNLMLGARGNVAERFYYNLKLGYAFRNNGLLWGFDAAGQPTIGYADKYHLFYTDLSLGWKADYLNVDGRFLLQKTSLNEERLFAPALIEASLSAIYNWGDRIRAGVTAEGQTERAAQLGALPGYVDLGLLGDLQMTRKLGFWLRIGNLLNQPVQRVPFHAENGIYFTVGARLNF